MVAHTHKCTHLHTHTHSINYASDFGINKFPKESINKAIGKLIYRRHYFYQVELEKDFRGNLYLRWVGINNIEKLPENDNKKKKIRKMDSCKFFRVWDKPHRDK